MQRSSNAMYAVELGERPQPTEELILIGRSEECGAFERNDHGACRRFGRWRGLCAARLRAADVRYGSKAVISTAEAAGPAERPLSARSGRKTDPSLRFALVHDLWARAPRMARVKTYVITPAADLLRIGTGNAGYKAICCDGAVLRQLLYLALLFLRELTAWLRRTRLEVIQVTEVELPARWRRWRLNRLVRGDDPLSCVSRGVRRRYPCGQESQT